MKRQVVIIVDVEALFDFTNEQLEGFLSDAILEDPMGPYSFSEIGVFDPDILDGG